MDWAKRTVLVVVMVGAAMSLSGRPASAMDPFAKVWLRDVAVGAAGGLAISLAAERDSFNWVLAGAVVGGVFGYFDAEKGIISYTPERGWSVGAPEMTVNVETTRKGDRPVLKAALLHAEW